MKLVACNLSKTIKGKQILNNVNLCMSNGNIHGFIGRNGSGKTMLFRALSGLMRTDAGYVELNEKRLHRDFSILPNMGIVLENAGLFPNLTGFENLKYLASFNKKVGEKEIAMTLERVGLDPKDKRVYGKYSLGMKQRLAIAQAIMEKPDIIMLDEPTNSLDEVGVEEIRKILLEEKERGAMILLASHNKEDIGSLVDELYEVNEGRVTRK